MNPQSLSTWIQCHVLMWNPQSLSTWIQRHVLTWNPQSLSTWIQRHILTIFNNVHNIYDNIKFNKTNWFNIVWSQGAHVRLTVQAYPRGLEITCNAPYKFI